MENGPNGPLSEIQVPEHANNGVVAPVMAKFPEGDDNANQQEKANCVEVVKINGDSNKITNIDDNSYSSESDALVIDESVVKKQKNIKKKVNKKLTLHCEEEVLNDFSEAVTHSNPYFNESLFELSQLHQNVQEDETVTSSLETKSEKSARKLKKKLKPKQKLTEYAQYLGLQPSVQFKCVKCNRSGFESLASLQEHIIECNEEIVQEVSKDNSYSGFKLTRKVFLCSACGTYYENWNLYIHMLEFHKRFICLYCLGMFSLLEDLCQHIQFRHNLEPGYKNTLDEFFNVYNEPCYLACCECDKLFSEQDNFFYHNCSGKSKLKKQPIKQQITPENHITGDSETNTEIKEAESENIESTNIMESRNIMNNVENSIDNSQNGNDDEISIKSSIHEENNQHEQALVANTNSKPATPNETHNNLLINQCNDEANLSEHQSSEEDNKDEKIENFDTLSNRSVDLNYQTDILAHKKDTEEIMNEEITEETRKVPKLSLKLNKIESYEPDPEDSDDSEKLTMEIDQIESEYENEFDTNHSINQVSDDIKVESLQPEIEPVQKSTEHKLQVAGPDIAVIELQLEQPLDKFDPRILLQKCLTMTVPTCIYCNHARKIAVNGRQLGLHCIAEHRFSAIVNSITAEELIPQNFVNRIEESLEELSSEFFSLESSFSNEAITFSHLFECFQCHFSSIVHKDLYLHNRKFHAKNMLLCIMCKTNFYSYCELVCHLCPGVYILDYELKFKCCICVHDDLPSSFRLMVHLRKKHNICDICLNSCDSQHQLTNHVWKHKLHHICYRCGIAYRNKSDITRHLFWKHGTESVLCKKCLHKKWPHVYHFCVPPFSFVCDECGLEFTRAVSLKVHKRLHSNEKKHACTFENCEEKFISKKLLEKHERSHFEPPEEIKKEEIETLVEDVNETVQESETVKEEEKVEDKPKPKIDVLEDLPALNLSESDSSSESEGESDPPIKPDPPAKSEPSKENCLNIETEIQPPGALPPLDILQEDKVSLEPPAEEPSSSVMQNIWDNFKNFQEQQHKLDHMFNDQEKTEEVENHVDEVEEQQKQQHVIDVALREHDYCANPEETTKDITLVEVKPALAESVDHDYCFAKPESTTETEKEEAPVEQQQQVNSVNVEKKKEEKSGSSSSSSSDSDSSMSSCNCKLKCSCSSTSSSSSSSSDSSSSDNSSEEAKKRQLARKEKRMERARKLKEEQEQKTKVDVTTDITPIKDETPIRESDLETTESETDEEFYDVAPQKLAKKILEEKRQQLLELMGPNNIPNGSFIESTSRPPTPPAEVLEPEEKKKKKSKSKKKKKKRSERRLAEVHEDASNNISYNIPIPPYYQQFHQQQQQQQVIQPQPQSVAPITLTISRNSPISSPSVSVSTPPSAPTSTSKVQTEPVFSRQDSSDSSLRASKRRRVRNKFYGYSSDEEDKQDKTAAKYRKVELQTPRSPLVVAPITIKTQPPPPPPPPPQPPIEPISIRTGAHLSDFRVQRPRPKVCIPPSRPLNSQGLGDRDSGSDSNDSSSEEPSVTPKPAQPQLYCYCQCPYDEVSEMIGCDATDCEIEWFHFECVGIMVPPKGQWFCPDCRKKKARRELLQGGMKSN